MIPGRGRTVEGGIAGRSSAASALSAKAFRNGGGLEHRDRLAVAATCAHVSLIRLCQPLQMQEGWLHWQSDPWTHEASPHWQVADVGQQDLPSRVSFMREPYPRRVRRSNAAPRPWAARKTVVWQWLCSGCDLPVIPLRGNFLIPLGGTHWRRFAATTRCLQIRKTTS